MTVDQMNEVEAEQSSYVPLAAQTRMNNLLKNGKAAIDGSSDVGVGRVLPSPSPLSDPCSGVE